MMSRYYHTLKHLKLSQITAQIRYRCYRPRPDLRIAGPLRKQQNDWHVFRLKAPTMLGAAQFVFLNDTQKLSFPDAWNSMGKDKLWLYNLHYFDDLNASNAEQRRIWHVDLIQQWITDNPPASGVGWEAYPLSLRIVNWIIYSLSGQSLPAVAIYSLAVQSRQLRRCLEFRLLGNHLFENAKALIFAGLFFAGEEAEEWFKTGSLLLHQQIREQILEDGGHFELSPMYHAQILTGMLDLNNLYHTFNYQTPEIWQDVIIRMLNWLRHLCHPDGDIAFFNDAAFDISPQLAQLQQYAASLGMEDKPQPLTSRLLNASGYARLEAGEAVMFADVAAIGSDYIPGHAHADSLSFELSVKGQRLLVNSGTSIYESGSERQRQRGTAAHNTLRIDRVNSSDVWSRFRVGRRAKVKIERFETQAKLLMQAAHDGYQHLAGQPTHQRRWTMDASSLTIIDNIAGNGNHMLELFFHFHPDCLLESTQSNIFYVRQQDGQMLLEIQVDNNADWQIKSGHWYPRFGVAIPNLCLYGCYQGLLTMRFTTMLRW